MKSFAVVAAGCRDGWPGENRDAPLTSGNRRLGARSPALGWPLGRGLGCRFIPRSVEIRNRDEWLQGATLKWVMPRSGVNKDKSSNGHQKRPPHQGGGCSLSCSLEADRLASKLLVRVLIAPGDNGDTFSTCFSIGR